jgi:hypothetical protein
LAVAVGRAGIKTRCKIVHIALKKKKLAGGTTKNQTNPLDEIRPG